MEKRIFVIDELCNGCRACQMWCSFVQKERNEFNPSCSKIKIATDSDGAFDMPIVDCSGGECPHIEGGEPLCVQMCPTGALIYTDAEDAYQKRLELHRDREKQPLFKLIAPWKWPYPWKAWQKKEREVS